MIRAIRYENIQPYYYIDTSGNVYSFSRKGHGKKMCCDTDKDGYYRVSLQTTDNTRRSFRINRLVALMYIDNPNGFPVVHHIDNNKKNNDVENLEWVSISKNTKEGYNNNNYHYTKRVMAIQENGESMIFDSAGECAKYFDCDYSIFSKVINEKLDSKSIRKLAGTQFMVL